MGESGCGKRFHLYEEVAERIGGMIEQGAFRAGERIPSVRALSRRFGVGVGTVMGAYRLLEDRGIIRARPQSGYYVNARPAAISPEPETTRETMRPARVGGREISLGILHASGLPGLAPLGAAVPNPELLPADRLNRMLAGVLRRRSGLGVAYDETAGCEALRVQIARRSLDMGCSLSPEEIITTAGCIEAVSLALRVTCRPGDIVAVESPTYYNFLLLLKELDLQVLEIPCSPVDGVSLDALRHALEHHRIAACLFNTNFNNPIGSLMPEEHKRELAALLERYDTPLIEDDLNGDLPLACERPKTVKAFDRKGLVLLCSSYSKTLAPGYRVGWIAPGRYFNAVEQLKRIVNISTSIPPQLAVAEFLADGGYDRHLRKVRRAYASRMAGLSGAVINYFPEGTRISSPAGGFVLWVELPPGCEAFTLYERAMEHSISIAPGPIFSAGGKYAACIRLNAAFWSPKIEGAVERLGKLAAETLP